jgi:hypothetical protein
MAGGDDGRAATDAPNVSGTAQRNAPDTRAAGGVTRATTGIATAASRLGSVRTVGPPGSKATVTVPSRSVRNTVAPASANRWSVERAGCPYGLSAPAEAIAMRGRTASTKAWVVAVLLP